MRALIRGEEVYTEDCWSEFTRNHLRWMTGTETDDDGRKLPGDGWTLVENYVAPAEHAASYDVVKTEDVTVTEDTVVIDGREYTKAELRALLGE